MLTISISHFLWKTTRVETSLLIISSCRLPKHPDKAESVFPLFFVLVSYWLNLFLSLFPKVESVALSEYRKTADVHFLYSKDYR